MEFVGQEVAQTRAKEITTSILKFGDLHKMKSWGDLFSISL